MFISVRMLLLRNIRRFQPSKDLWYAALFRRPLFTGRTIWQTASKLKALKALKLKQAKMQCDDGYPVHLKKGTSDKLLMNLTIGLTIFGLINVIFLLIELSKY